MDTARSWIDELLSGGVSITLPLGDGGEIHIGERPGIPYPWALLALAVILLLVIRSR